MVVILLLVLQLDGNDNAIERSKPIQLLRQETTLNSFMGNTIRGMGGVCVGKERILRNKKCHGVSQTDIAKVQ